MMVKIQKFVMMLVLGMMVVSPMVVDAQGLTKPTAPTGVKQEANLNTMITDVINVILGIVGSIALLMIVIAGVIYVTAGDSGRTETAQKMITAAIVGLVIVLLAYAIVNLVLVNLGAPIK